MLFKDYMQSIGYVEQEFPQEPLDQPDDTAVTTESLIQQSAAKEEYSIFMKLKQMGILNDFIPPTLQETKREQDLRIQLNSIYLAEFQAKHYAPIVNETDNVNTSSVSQTESGTQVKETIKSQQPLLHKHDQKIYNQFLKLGIETLFLRPKDNESLDDLSSRIDCNKQRLEQARKDHKREKDKLYRQNKRQHESEEQRNERLVTVKESIAAQRTAESE